MILTITKYLAGCLVLGLFTACGSLSSKQTLAVEMYGVSKSPESATGDRDPNFQTYQLLKVELLSAAGSDPTILFDNEEEKIFRIVDREQQILDEAISELEGTDFTGIQLSFDPAVTGGQSTGDEFSFTLSSPTLSLNQAFRVEKAKSLTLQVKIDWGNTLSDTAMTEPTFTLSLQ